MQIRPNKTRILMVTGLSLVLGGCSISDWYNGYYVERSAIKRYDKASNAYYAAESPQMKELRRKNQIYCRELASKPENRVAKAGYANGVFNGPMYDVCMDNHGTPTYASYASMQAKKRRAERRARGEIVPEHQ